MNSCLFLIKFYFLALLLKGPRSNDTPLAMRTSGAWIDLLINKFQQSSVNVSFTS